MQKEEQNPQPLKVSINWAPGRTQTHVCFLFAREKYYGISFLDLRKRFHP